MMSKQKHSPTSFQGFQSPNYTNVPDELFDQLMVDLTGAELKVLLYIIRRTFGFKRDSDNISLSQMLNGLQTRDGRTLDRGVGLSKKTLLQALNSLEEQQVILTERRQSPEKGNEPTTYRLNIVSSTRGHLTKGTKSYARVVTPRGATSSTRRPVQLGYTLSRCQPPHPRAST